MAAGFKYPPASVETTPTSSDVVPLREAARRLGRDHRTLQRMIIAGTLRGGAEPQPHRLRWYVYRDELPAPPGAPEHNQPTAAPVSPDDQPPHVLEQLAAQRAKIAALEHNQRLLAGAVGDLLEAFDEYKLGTKSALDAAQHFETSADRFAASLRQHRDVLGQHLTPADLSTINDAPA
ncbi:hypothetical protein AN480_27125 (plasmid) [Mycobacterium intracellulare subsp. chimaera]|nr:hypothetical protein AN480_27125 [Mycobacterium intracellulare subsp. chimaera]PBA69131.1 hypothetical protein CKJ76_24195 [Mycobacterium avium]